jgi:hypothetical protein
VVRQGAAIEFQISSGVKGWGVRMGNEEELGDGDGRDEGLCV